MSTLTSMTLTSQTFLYSVKSVMTKFIFNGFLKCFSNLVTRVNAQNQRKYTKDKRKHQAVDQNDFGKQNIFWATKVMWPRKAGKTKTGNPANKVNNWLYKSRTPRPLIYQAWWAGLRSWHYVLTTTALAHALIDLDRVDPAGHVGKPMFY